MFWLFAIYCTPQPVVIGQDSNSQNTETTDRTKTPRISRSGARPILVQHRQIARVVQSENAGRSERRRRSSLSRSRSVLLRCDPRCPCSGCSRSMHSAAGSALASLKLPEHGDHRSHRNTTDKPIWREADLRTTPAYRTCCSTNNEGRSERRRRSSHSWSRSVLLPCNPRSPCSGCSRSMHSAAGSNWARF